ncbi:MAG: hypothetical protein IPF53_16865 [Blastocatellia bacterium]|nr:hypothetical protein [Blastocatellia bacterium]
MQRIRIGSRTARAVAALVVAIVAGISANAVLGAPPPQTTWTTSADRTDVRRGEIVALRIKLTLQENWYVYSMTTPEGGGQPTRISLAPSDAFEPAGSALQPKPESKFDENFQVPTEQFHKEVVFTVPVRIRDSAVNGSLRIAGEVAFQVCDPKQCIPGKVPFEVALNVIDGPAAAEFASVKTEGLVAGTAVGVWKPKEPVASAANPESGPAALPAGSMTGDAASVERAKGEGLFAYLWLAITAGFLSLLTPCVFPMVPITVSYFTKHEGQSRGRGIADATIYSLSIIVTFTVLGLLTSALFGATGLNSVASNPWVNIALAAIFVGLALNLFGFYEIVIPSSVLTPLSKMSGSGGFIGTLLMGVTFTLTSFTCTVPLVGALLVSTAQGDWMWPLVGMLGYSAAFALPFFFRTLSRAALVAAEGWRLDGVDQGRDGLPRARRGGEVRLERRSRMGLENAHARALPFDLDRHCLRDCVLSARQGPPAAREAARRRRRSENAVQHGLPCRRVLSADGAHGELARRARGLSAADLVGRHVGVGEGRVERARLEEGLRSGARRRALGWTASLHRLHGVRVHELSLDGEEHLHGPGGA